MGGSFLRCGITLPSSVAVRDLDIMRVPLAPGKTDPPAVADPNAVLAGPVAFQRLQPVVPDGRKVGHTRGCIQPPQALACLLFDPAKPPAAKSFVHRPGFLASERANHRSEERRVGKQSR